jgi:hypothetical protein
MGINDNPPAILLLFVGLFTLLFAFLHSTGESRKLSTTQKLLYWSQRKCFIVFVVLLSYLAIDVVKESKGIWETILALSMHLIPTFILIAILVISWQR